MRIFILFFALSHSMNILSQEKFEKEYRVDREQIPVKSLNLKRRLNGMQKKVMKVKPMKLKLVI